MTFEDYIINDIALQDISQNVGALKQLFNGLTYTHIPIGRNGIYVGSISEHDVRCFEAEKPLEDCLFSFEGFFCHKTDNWLNVLENFAKSQTNIMPILNADSNYLGYVELNDIITLFNDTPFLNEIGAVLVIEKQITEYSFSEIAQIIESNDAKLLGCFISNTENDRIQITVKISHSTINEVLQAFRRYNYSILSTHQEDAFYKSLKERSKYLEKYLNI